MLSYGKKSAKTTGVQWFNLDDDAWSNIINRLDVLDLQNFMATCQRWREVTCNLQIKPMKSGIPVLATSRADSNHSRIYEPLGDGSFGLHGVSEGTSFLVHSKYLKDKVWVGGKDDWLVISDNRWSLELLNLVTGQTVPLPSFSVDDNFTRNQYSKHQVICGPYVGNLLRVVLCQTPSSNRGHLAIALFDRDVLAYTSKGTSTWTFINADEESPFNGLSEVYMDAIIHNGRVVAVDTEGFVFSFHMGNQDKNPVKISSADIHCGNFHYNRIYYLAKSCDDEVILICVQGDGNRFKRPYYRVLKSALDRFEFAEEMKLFKFDDIGELWRPIGISELGTTLFLGLNYPFHGTWSGIKPNSVYVANMIDNDVLIFSKEGESYKPSEKQNYPVKKGKRLYVRESMRTPMWFRPTNPVLDKHT